MNDQDFVLRLVALDAGLAVAASHRAARSENEVIGAEELKAALSPGPDLRETGCRLYRMIFRESVRDLFALCREAEMFRIVVELPKPLDARTRLLHELPWETLHDETDYLAARERSPVIRRIAVPTIRLPKPDWPLRILLTTANPPESPPLALEKEEEEVRIALRELGGNVVLTVLREISFESLQQEYRKASDRGAGFHIWHHCGHGILGDSGDLAGMRDLRRPRVEAREEGFELLLHGESGEAEGVASDDIGRLIADNRSLSLAVLNVCLGANAAGLGPRLASLGVVDTVAFGHPVADGHAVRFASTFYKNLASQPLDQIVVRCRQSVSALIGNLVHYSRAEEAWRLAKAPAPGSAADAASRSVAGGISQMAKLRVGNATETFLFRGLEGLEIDYFPEKGDGDVS